MFLPEAFRMLPLAGSTTRMVDCWMGPRDLCWYRAWLLKELRNTRRVLLNSAEIKCDFVKAC